MWRRAAECGWLVEELDGELVGLCIDCDVARVYGDALEATYSSNKLRVIQDSK